MFKCVKYYKLVNANIVSNVIKCSKLSIVSIISIITIVIIVSAVVP